MLGLVHCVFSSFFYAQDKAAEIVLKLPGMPIALPQ